MDIGHLIEENISDLEKTHKGVLWTAMERRGSGVEVQLRGDLEEVGMGLELGNCPWEEVDVPHTEEGFTLLISACQKGMIEGELLSGMFRPLPHRAELLQAAWQGDLHSLQHLLAQTDLLDVNTQNQEGLTPLMLAVRDVDLFEGLGVRLPWEYRPVEVVRELLALAADLRVRDHRGCSALHYAAHINSPLKEELIQMMVESLRQPAPTPLDLQCFHPPEEELRTNNCPSPSVLTHSFLIQTAACTEEVLESSECVPLSEHHKAVGQDKGISLCFQSAMDTLRGMRQAYQDVGKGNSRGSSLPRLWDRGRHWDKLSTLDPPPGPLKTTGTSCLPVPPRPRGRCESVAHSPANLAVPQPSQLSQSAPTLMEPLLDSSSLLQARAHIQNRLGCGETEKNNSGRKGSLPALRPGPIRTPKLLAPLEGRPRDQGLLPGLKYPPSLKPISLLPLCSMSRMRRERLTRGSPRGPLTTRGGSEESSSSSTSSQSSIDLEEEEEVEDHDDNHIHSENSEKQHGEAFDERLHMDLDSSAKFHVDDYSEARADRKIRDSMINQLSIAKDINNGEQPIKSHSEGRRCFVALTREGVSETKHRLTFDFTDNKDVDSTSCYERNSGDELGALGEFSKEEPHIDLSLATCSSVSKRHGDKEIQVDHRNVKFGGVDTKYQCHPHMVNITLSDLNQGKIKPIKPVRNKDRRGSFQTNQSFNALAHKDHIGGNVKYKGNQRTSSIPSQVKAKVRKSPDLVISSEVTVRSKLNSAKIIQKNTDMTSVRKRVTEPLRPTTKRSNTDKKTLNNTKAPNQKQLPQREPKSARQPKKSGALSTPRAKSAVDYITYNDMFQEINSGDDEGPAIYEMFAGPVYDNLRVSSSCERSRQVQSAPPRKTHQAHRIKHKCPKPLEGSNRQRRSPVDKLVSTKGKQRKSRAIITRGKPRPTPATMDEREDEDDDDVVVMSRLDWHIQASKTNLVLNDDDNDDDDGETIAPKTPELEVGDHTLSVIEEVLSSHASETLIPHYRSGDKTIPSLTETKHIPHPDTAERFREQEKVGSMGNMYDTGNNYCKSNRLDPEYTSSGSPVQPKINTWTSDSCDRTMSPVFQKFLDEVGEGPLTEDLLRCLAEELISLDERDERDEMVRDASLGPENCDSHKQEFTHDSATRHDKLRKDITSPGRVLSGSELVVDDAISWTKGEVLGRGAYGTVYCGLTSQGQLIAVKQVVLDASDPDTADKEYNRLQDEVDLLKNLRHSNIVGFLDTSLRHNVVSIFMEYVPGGSISSVLHRFGPLPERVLALYTQQILEGVAYLHLNRVIHRDLKGNNIMLMPTGVVKLIDFGCARRLSRLTHTSSRSELLKSVHGTPYWMAPEVINETGHGRKSDIWSIGCTVFEMATGKPPLSHMDKMAALFYIGARRGLMPSLPEGFSEDARDFVQVCLTSDQKQRPSAEQLLEHRFIPKTEVGQSLI